jgi:hypothetical protein
MSTAQRALELAVRNQVTVEGIAAFEEAARAIQQSGSPTPAELAADDAAFKRAAAVASDSTSGLILTPASEDEAQVLEAEEAARAEAEATGEVPADAAQAVEEKKQSLTELSTKAKVRMAMVGNAFARSVLIRDSNHQVAMACIRSPAVTNAEAANHASNRSLDEDVIRFIANKRQWVRLYGIKVALCNNPKCPMPRAMSFLPHLRAPDLKALARSKGIPSALANAAKQLLQSRTQ